MKKAIYEFHSSGYEHNERIIFEGPKVEDWAKFCDQIVVDATVVLILRQGEAWRNKRASNKLDTIHPEDIISEVVNILEGIGYKRLHFEAAGYFVDSDPCYEHDETSGRPRGILLPKDIVSMVETINSKYDEISYVLSRKRDYDSGKNPKHYRLRRRNRGK